WPVPPRFLAQPIPVEYRTVMRPARPARRLLLVMRHDLRPTWKVEARRALAHGLNRAAILTSLGPRGAQPANTWLTGGEPAELPRRDGAAVREWLARGKFGRSLHASMAYAADGVGSETARAMQTEWAEAGLDVELRPLRPAAMAAEMLGRGGAPMLLLETQAPFEDAVSELGTLVQPRNLPPVGGFRTGWSSAEFDRWLGPQPPQAPLDIAYAQRRLGEELVTLPLARLPWLWVERPGGAWLGLHPRLGPGVGWSGPAAVASSR
ncbi:MAG TPA: ABC transporter substrate-binding protein, partial [Candidatus Eisenbacteria bacterium]|nr:ABC transporter substrate-binding protein [Candidatus Eisenbacteria bacterium]